MHRLESDDNPLAQNKKAVPEPSTVDGETVSIDMLLKAVFFASEKKDGIEKAKQLLNNPELRSKLTTQQVIQLEDFIKPTDES